MNFNAVVGCQVVLLIVAAQSGMVQADGERLEYVAEVNAGVDAVWTAFTTRDGLQSWMAPQVEIELKVGGLMKSNYAPGGRIGDATTIENTILSYDPKRMLSLKATKFPTGFPFAEAAAETWSVFYFEPLDTSRTRIRIVGLGYSDTEQSRQMKAFFEAANAQSIKKLNASLSQQ